MAWQWSPGAPGFKRSIKIEPNMDQEKSPVQSTSIPTYGPQDRFLKIEEHDSDEEPALKQIVYRCPHKRDVINGEGGGRCNAKETDFNLLLNHFYKHHAKERLLSSARPTHRMCCFRADCTSKFWNHKELVEHMYEHDKDPAENIYFVSYIKQLYEKENKDLDLQVKDITEEVKNLKAEKNISESKYSKQETSNMKEINQLKSEKVELDLQVKQYTEEVKNMKAEKNISESKYSDREISNMKEINKLKLEKVERELKQQKKDKQYYKDKYNSEKAKNKEQQVVIEQHQTTIEKQHKEIDDTEETIRERTIKINLKDKQIKALVDKNEELETTIKTMPTSTSTNLGETNKNLEKKDKKIEGLKRKVEILKKEVTELNKEVLNLKLKKEGSESDSDTDSSSDLEKKCKILKRKHSDSSVGSPKSRKKGEQVGHSSDEPSDTENISEEGSLRKKNCKQNVSSQSEYEEYVERDSNLEQEEYVEPDGN